jgi:hypothetical protein
MIDPTVETDEYRGYVVTDRQLLCANEADIILTHAEINALNQYNVEFYKNTYEPDPYSLFEDFPHHLVRDEISIRIMGYQRDLYCEVIKR